MSYNIKKVAKDYIYKRFPKASVLEKEKYVKDWENKMKDSFALVDDFKKRIGEVSGKKILDAGCGNGGISIAFAIAGAEVHGVEIEEDLYQISKSHAEIYSQEIKIQPNFYLYDGYKLPFEDNFFDYTVSASVLEHTDDPAYYLKEILRVTKPEGVLYLGFPNKWAPRETHTQLLFLTYLPAFLRPTYIKIFKRNPLEDNNLHFYSYFDLQKMVKENKDQYSWVIVEEKGHSQSFIKKIIKKALAFCGISYKTILPHILVILKKEKIK